MFQKPHACAYQKLFKYCNSINRELVSSIARSFKDKRHLRIIEIGVGHGGCTKSVLPVLDPEQTTYMFTDISGYFLQDAKTTFEAYPFVDFGLLNIESSIETQGVASTALTWSSLQV